MTYRCDLGMGQCLSVGQYRSGDHGGEHGVDHRIDHGAEQTVITLATSSPGQQQQSSCSVTTGRWVEPPQVFRSGHRVVLKLITAQGDRFIYIEGQSITTAGAAVDLSQAQSMPMVWIESVASSMPPMTPMTPMPPMTPMTPIDNRGAMSMGTMQMSMQPMEMRLGNMVMRADAIAAESAAHSTSQASAQSVSHTAGYAETAAEATAQSTTKATAEGTAESTAETSPAPASSSPRFCSQCGSAVKIGDRFCASCGHRLG